MVKILVVDDEKEIRDICKTYFEFEGYEVVTAIDGAEALILLDHSIDVMILDIMMPGMDGYEFVHQAKMRGFNMPYLYLTAKVNENDTIYGLTLGAEDYIKKPFSPRELVLRTKKIINRNTKVSDVASILTFGNLVLNDKHKAAYVDGEDLLLRQKEYELLHYLALNVDAAIAKSELLNHVWGYEYYEDMNTLNVHIHRIREKLDQHGYKAYCIQTVWGLGYKFERGDVIDN
ncbi:DNA-binding response regulator [Macrococcoides goetzii]|uniref:Response regulator SaeR n=1 Tax=Macrococcoides goetzii TaxID=1891097 RepID=A0A395GAS5_9STAP|nr:response regulator transcription factor [Macrococcus goetzii]RAI81100.1 DNA-binding response regulator [Macrococcus goetzii]